MFKRAILILFFGLLFCINVSALSSASAQNDDFYQQQYELSGADSLEDTLPKQAQEFINDFEIDLSQKDWVNKITAENVFVHILNFLKSGAKTPLVCGAGILSIILVSAAIGSFSDRGTATATALYATTLACAAVIITPVFSAVSATVDAMKASTVFMTSFIPIFAVIVAASGGAVTSVSMSSLLLGAAQVVNYVSNFAVTPLMSGYLALSLSASVSPLIEKTGIADGVKKLSFWLMSLITTVFIGILSIQTVVNASADTLSLRTAKFIIGSAVPVAGTALSEALTTVTASMGMLKSSVGIYGVVACCVIFLPLLAELLIWRVMCVIISVVADLFSLSKISGLLRSVDTVMTVLIGIILLTCAMFVISLSVVVSAGKSG